MCLNIKNLEKCDYQCNCLNNFIIAIVDKIPGDILVKNLLMSLIFFLSTESFVHNNCTIFYNNVTIDNNNFFILIKKIPDTSFTSICIADSWVATFVKPK